MTPISAQQQKLSESDLRSLARQAISQLADAQNRLKAADDLIIGQSDELKASERERALAKEERETLQRIVSVRAQEVEAYRSALESEKLAAGAMKENLVVQIKEVERQKRKVSSANKRAMILTIAGVVAGFWLKSKF